MRKCPVCDDKPMQALPLKTVEYDRCTGCGGMWFEAGELAAVIPPDSLARFLSAARDQRPLCRTCGGEIADGACTACSLAHVRCPDCGRRDLVNLIVGSTEIEVCSPCGGFWLDAGELKAIGEAVGRRVKESRGLIRGMPHAGAAAAAGAAALLASAPPPSNSASGIGEAVVDTAATLLDAIDVVDMIAFVFDVLTD